jgi:hypothetical protein
MRRLKHWQSSRRVSVRKQLSIMEKITVAVNRKTKMSTASTGRVMVFTKIHVDGAGGVKTSTSSRSRGIQLGERFDPWSRLRHTWW